MSAAPASTLDLIRPAWPAPGRVRSVATTRTGGSSGGPYATLNLGDHVGDDPAAVAANRARLRAELGLSREPAWLRQVHGAAVVHAADPGGEPPEADAAWTDRPGVACAVLTADCLPVLLCDRAGTRVAALHGGWRGLAAGVIEATLAAIEGSGVPPGELLAWLGPAIGPEAYEVGDEVRRALAARDPDAAAAAYQQTRPGHGHLDLYAYARARLEALGVPAVFGGDRCTLTDSGRFYSYRRDGTCGRQATLVWLQP